MSDDTRPLATLEDPAAPVPQAPRRRRRAPVLLVVGLALVLLLAGGALAAWRLLGSHGTRPEAVLPASTLAVVSLDLDPSAGQKVAAFRTLRKLPAYDENVGASTDDDLLRKVLDRAHREGSCPDLTFEKDLQPWLGRRAALGAVPLGGDKVVPALALQITDQDEARSGVRRLLGCFGSTSETGVALSDDYAVVSDSDAHARTVVAMGEKEPLADDAAYQRWTDAAGGHGILDFYVAKSAAARIREELQGGFGLFPRQAALTTPAHAEGAALRGTRGSASPRAADDPLAGFEGAAGTIRFADGDVELDLAAASTRLTDGGGTVGDQVTHLPGDTAVALGYAVSPQSARTLSDAIASQLGDQLGDLQEQTGLSLPEDLQTLLGKAIVFSVGGTPPEDLASVSSPQEVPAGVLIQGDPDKIEDVIGRVEEHAGRRLSDQGVQVQDKGDELALATGQDYARDLLGSGSLGEQQRFRDAVPDAGKAMVVAYADLDGRWADAVMRTLQDQGADGARLRRNLLPLQAVGLHWWVDGKVAHGQLRVTLD